MDQPAEDVPDAPVAGGEAATRTRSQRPTSQAFRSFIASGWGDRPEGLPDLLPAASQAEGRRERLSQLFPGERIVVPAGTYKQRNNDCDYRFRPHTAFSYLTGLGGEREPDAVLVLEPAGAGGEAGPDSARPGHDPVLYFRPRAERDSHEFYADARYGELWVGVRASLAELGAQTGLVTLHLDGLLDAVTKDLGGIPVRIVREADAALTAHLDQARIGAGIDLGPDGDDDDSEGADGDTSGDADDSEHAGDSDEAAGARQADAALAAALSTMRLVKEPWEVDQMRAAVAATEAGFDAVVAELPRAVGHQRGERILEGVFSARARELGNGLGYDVIAAAGPHACTLHWIRNDGPVRAGDLVLVDAGVEIDSLYTADVTRTLPVSGTFSEPQRRVYNAVLDAADAAFAVARPGATLADVHEAAMRVLAERLASWGLLPVDVEAALDRETGGQHRRWVVHGTSHHLGLDVHDCALARREDYIEGPLAPGMVFTIEPGLYFRSDDLLVPEEMRGIGVRIEDDVVVTDDGCANLTAGLPRHPDAVQAWVRDGIR